MIVGIVLLSKLLEVLLRDAWVFPRLVTRKMCSALTSCEARDRPLHHIAAIHEVHVALERCDESLERIDFHLELQYIFPCEVSLFEKDANGTSRGSGRSAKLVVGVGLC